ncbi:MAG: carboxymuconolactone decarboxylase family protein [Planktotalea sp.]|jgi:4-carboxymuconolactone decarboxylase|uniref:carboxymuconolactone decarboxylase family protein n=1 Tax=Planktotalea sp. TaxID=2029877 RepID=UPI0002F32B8C|nr:carboxymuconolactone decarboxylase family protein [Planktotalea sp.]MDG1077065.1 carboxymuconolactone decarboxylase family protein [Planktotalea sp.]MDG1084965.1 carboxymuconolactone decarboxylase family protein [Planktotalea sp.]HCW82655.1 carboxymuconolactone decarboxylase family protein [Paracoccaceae bacterium]
MTDANNPFAMMMAQAQEMAKALNPALSGASTQAMENLWPTMTKDMMEMSFGKGASKEGLDAKTRLLLTLAGLTMQGAQNETQIRMTVRHAVEAGATKDEVTESIAQMSMFAGLPAMTRAMEFANEVLQVSKEAQT